MILFKLFIVFSKVSLFAFGGAYSFLPLLEHELVRQHHWLEPQEFLDIVGFVELFPGAISIKFATYTGYKIAGFSGAVIANIANLLPTAVLMLIASVLYSRYKNIVFIKAGFDMIRYAIFAMIICMVVQLVDKKHILELKYLFVVAVSFVLFLFTKIHPAFVIVAAGLFGAIIR